MTDNTNLSSFSYCPLPYLQVIKVSELQLNFSFLRIFSKFLRDLSYSMINKARIIIPNIILLILIANSSTYFAQFIFSLKSNGALFLQI